MTNKRVLDPELIDYSNSFCDKCKTPLYNELLIEEFADYSCWKCGKDMSIILVAAVIDGNDKLKYQERTKENMNYHLDYLTNDDIGQLITQRFPYYFKDYSKTVDMEYYMSHCPHCKSKQGDFFVYSEWSIGIVYKEELSYKTTKIPISDEEVKHYVSGGISGKEINSLEFLCENCFRKKTSDFTLFKRELRKKKMKSRTDEDFPFWLPVSVNHAEEIGELINDEYTVTCVYDKIFKFLDFEFESLQIGWSIKIPSELITRFQANLDEYPLFTSFVSNVISSNPNQHLREYEITKTKINLIYANTTEIKKYKEQLVSKKV